MKCILLADVKSLGKKGDIVDVSTGYARNMLIPKKLGIEATPENLNNLKLQNKHAEKVAAENLAAAKALAEEMSTWTVETSIKTGEGGRTFGSISSKEIVASIKKQYQKYVDKKKVQLHPEVTATIRVHVAEA